MYTHLASFWEDSGKRSHQKLGGEKIYWSTLHLHRLLKQVAWPGRQTITLPRLIMYTYIYIYVWIIHLRAYTKQKNNSTLFILVPFTATRTKIALSKMVPSCTWGKKHGQIPRATLICLSCTVILSSELLSLGIHILSASLFFGFFAMPEFFCERKIWSNPQIYPRIWIFSRQVLQLFCTTVTTDQ